MATRRLGSSRRQRSGLGSRISELGTDVIQGLQKATDPQELLMYLDVLMTVITGRNQSWSALMEIKLFKIPICTCSISYSLDLETWAMG